ncbi:MAG: hypothetical protein KDE51_06205 [Anaerolineales bacterium]|nr:hypothetical protein [Anaerolineales bacterium]
MNTNYKELIILHSLLMQDVQTPDEVVELCRMIAGNETNCSVLLQATKRDALLQLIELANRRATLGRIIEYFEDRYFQIDLDERQLDDIFQRGAKRERQQQVNNLILGNRPKPTTLFGKLRSLYKPQTVSQINFGYASSKKSPNEQIVDWLAHLSNDDLHYLCFLLGLDMEMFSYGAILDRSVSLGRLTEEQIEEEIKAQGYDKETANRYRKMMLPASEEVLRQVLMEASIKHEQLDLEQVRIEIRRLFAWGVMKSLETTNRFDDLLMAYTQI